MSDWLRVLPQLPDRVLKNDSPFSSARGHRAFQPAESCAEPELRRLS
ncbi:Mycobacterium numidiamassiliense ORFan [Mycobacterium numidiamassiliense]|uniref:Mycobacterium numidiamassiliense ORFan n=1 Tax=Mycobacterium numidiamassiliense TaxID=1841861 RepID=A0A2U3PG54_9MYCO|nr:Mycobacterium numidiamassiliense ORFan [Mycobacterium numidiamassiliense]